MVEVITQAQLKEKVEDREYSFYCANTAELPEIYGVLLKMSGYILKRLQEIHNAQVPKEAEPEAPKEV